MNVVKNAALYVLGGLFLILTLTLCSVDKRKQEPKVIKLNCTPVEE